MNLPAKFIQTQVDMYGEEGQAWVDGLPALLDEFAGRWGLQIGEPFDNLSYNFVAVAMRGEDEVVIKAGFPSQSAEALGEIRALHHFGGRGAVWLLEHDMDRRVLLLERAMPGTMLSESADDEFNTLTAARVMRRLHRPPGPGEEFGHLANWVAGFARLRERFEGSTGPLPADMVERAETLGAELLASSKREVVLHGDFHHSNILRGHREPWLTIDPKGIVGDPVYEVAPFLANPGLQSAEVLSRRIDIFEAELGFDRDRILAWGQVYAMMSAWWTIEDNGEGWEEALEFGRRLMHG